MFFVKKNMFFLHFASIILILTWISGKNWRWWISSNGIKLKCEARETKSRQKQFTPLYSPGISVFCAPWENWAKLLALGKCKKKIQGNRRKLFFQSNFFQKSRQNSYFDRKCPMITLSNQPERLIFMIIVNAKENRWKRNIFWVGTIFPLYLQF